MPDEIRAGWYVALGNNNAPADKQFDWIGGRWPE
jgi:hypothetical protein